MKLTQVLLAGAVALIASNAMAYDIAHPFWGTSQGQFASETDYAFTRTDYNWGANQYYQRVIEKVSYGVTNDWTVFGHLAKAWDKENNGYHNKANDWALGTTYNLINNGRSFAQAGIGYGQQKWEGEDNMVKYYQLYFKGGYNMGVMTPYAEAWIGNTLNEGSDNDAFCDLRLALNTNLTQKASTDIGLKYHRQESFDHTFALDAGVSYLFTKNVVGKVYGAFLLHDYEAGPVRTQREDTIGANLKVAF